MGSWNESIYGNDIAMDIFCILKEEYKNSNDFNKAIEECKKNFNYKYNEGKLLIADAEYFYNGKIENLDHINEVIDNELSLMILEDWGEPDKREKCIEQFENKINNTINMKNPTHNEILKWFEFIDNQDII